MDIGYFLFKKKNKNFKILSHWSLCNLKSALADDSGIMLDDGDI